MSLKCEELRNPRSCLNRAAVDEPVFVLRANDPIAAQTVRLWATMADGNHEPAKIGEAGMLAEQMDKWRADRQPKTVPVPVAAPRVRAPWDDSPLEPVARAHG